MPDTPFLGATGDSYDATVIEYSEMVAGDLDSEPTRPGGAGCRNRIGCQDGEPCAGIRSIHFDDPVDASEFAGLPGVGDVVMSGSIFRCTVDGRLDPVIKAAARHAVVDMLSAEPDLEETFLSYYHHLEGADDAAHPGA